MDMRQRIFSGLKEATKSQDRPRLSTLRLINAAIKDKEIAMRGTGTDLGDREVLGILDKMVRQRQESARAYEEGGRLDLAERERAEIKVIEEYLPKRLSGDEVARAVEKAIRAVDATSIRDMGRVIGTLKAEYMGQMDFARVGSMVKDRLG
ncbi:MAG: GatB/YqeY domain-containing protein [Rhodobacter sp.]|nr:GatB/YqeY domain-containing protein [Rhodobacter sp.]MCY4242593.1 GatB/YqeY domain-containing protein [Rhodobacter sp.]